MSHWWRNDGTAAFPWVVTAIVALGLGWAVGGGEGFGIALGLVGATGTILAALDARRSAEAGKRSANRLARSVDRIIALDDLRSLEGLRDAVMPLYLDMLDGTRGAVGATPFPLSEEIRSRYFGALGDALKTAAAIELPYCHGLHRALLPQDELRGLLGVEEVGDFGPLIDHAYEEIQSSQVLRRVRLGE